MQRVHVRVEVLASTHRCCTGHGVCVLCKGLRWWKRKKVFEKEKGFGFARGSGPCDWNLTLFATFAFLQLQLLGRSSVCACVVVRFVGGHRCTATLAAGVSSCCAYRGQGTDRPVAGFGQHSRHLRGCHHMRMHSVSDRAFHIFSHFPDHSKPESQARSGSELKPFRHMLSPATSSRACCSRARSVMLTTIYTTHKMSLF